MKFSQSISHFNENLHPHMGLMFKAMQNMKTDFDRELHCMKKRMEELESNNVVQCNKIKQLETHLAAAGMEIFSGQLSK